MRRACFTIYPVKTGLIGLGLLLGIFLSSLHAAPSPEAATTPAAVPAGLQDALRAIVIQIRDFDRKIQSLREDISTTTSEELRTHRVAELRELQKTREQARLDLLDIISNSDLSTLQKVEEQPFSFQGALEDLIKPLVEEGRRATAGSRERRDLEDRYNHSKEQTRVLKIAIDSLDRAIQQNTDPDIIALLTGLRQEFGQRYEDAQSEFTVLSFRLGEIKQKKHLLIDETEEIIVSFLRERGKTLLYALLAAAVVGISIAALHYGLHTHTTIFRKGRSQGARLLDVALYIITSLGALFAAVVVLLNAGDWVLLGLVVIIILALAFATKNALPGYIDQIRVMLNLGSVREGERIVFNGVPWVIENLKFFTILRNPMLRGGMIRMPISMLPDMLSRPAAENEPYFPSKEGDWVLLNDTTFGLVLFQSVEMVRLQLIGGALKMYSTAAYLAQHPQNFSEGFRITSTVGIDYENQPKATGQIVADLNEFFQEQVALVVDPAAIRSLKVEFELVNTSSLDYKVMLDLDGSVASQYFPITRALQRIGVDACTHLGLAIPFKQITLHQPDVAET